MTWISRVEISGDASNAVAQTESRATFKHRGMTGLTVQAPIWATALNDNYYVEVTKLDINGKYDAELSAFAYTSTSPHQRSSLIIPAKFLNPVSRFV
jgi:hypothetical protein